MQRIDHGKIKVWNNTDLGDDKMVFAALFRYLQIEITFGPVEAKFDFYLRFVDLVCQRVFRKYPGKTGPGRIGITQVPGIQTIAVTSGIIDRNKHSGYLVKSCLKTCIRSAGIGINGSEGKREGTECRHRGRKSGDGNQAIAAC